MASKQQQKAIEQLKKDIKKFHRDWIEATQKGEKGLKYETLKKLAADIQTLDRDAMKMKVLKEKRELIHYILTSPIGAPFASDTTLLESASQFIKNRRNRSFPSLLRNFIHYGGIASFPFLQVLDEIQRELL